MPNNNPEGRNQYSKNRTGSDNHRKSPGQDPAVHGRRDSGTSSDTARDDAHTADERHSDSTRKPQ